MIYSLIHLSEPFSPLPVSWFICGLFLHMCWFLERRSFGDSLTTGPGRGTKRFLQDYNISLPQKLAKIPRHSTDGMLLLWLLSFFLFSLPWTSFLYLINYKKARFSACLYSEKNNKEQCQYHIVGFSDKFTYP